MWPVLLRGGGARCERWPSGSGRGAHPTAPSGPGQGAAWRRASAHTCAAGRSRAGWSGPLGGVLCHRLDAAGSGSGHEGEVGGQEPRHMRTETGSECGKSGCGDTGSRVPVGTVLGKPQGVGPSAGSQPGVILSPPAQDRGDPPPASATRIRDESRWAGPRGHLAALGTGLPCPAGLPLWTLHVHPGCGPGTRGQLATPHRPRFTEPALSRAAPAGRRRPCRRRVPWPWTWFLVPCVRSGRRV